MNDELIVVRQLPKIEEHLRAFKAQVDERVNLAKQLVCTEETLAAVKAERAELKKQFNALENQRKEVKRQVLAPYEAFETVYAECVSNAFKEADAVLKSRIDEVEDGLKKQKGDEIKAYFSEYCTAQGVDFVPFDKAVPVINRSTSNKKYKEACKDFIDRAVSDLEMIATQEHPDEIRAEYKKCLNASEAVTTVINRHKAIEEEKAKAEAEKEAAEVRNQAATQVEKFLAAVESDGKGEAFTPPTAEPQEQTEQIYEVKFTVWETKEKIKALKEFLIKGEYKYE